MRSIRYITPVWLRTTRRKLHPPCTEQHVPLNFHKKTPFHFRKSAAASWKAANAVIWFICITSATMTGLSPFCVQLIAFTAACEDRSEWGSVCLPGPGGPQHNQPVQWLIKAQARTHKREGRGGGHSFPTAWASQRFLAKLLFGPLAHTKESIFLPELSDKNLRVQPTESCLLSFILCVCLCPCSCVQTAVQPGLSGGWPSQKHLLLEQLAFSKLWVWRRKTLHVSDVAFRKFQLHFLIFFLLVCLLESMCAVLKKVI